MTILIGIIVLVALISLYDYFTTRTWQQVTSTVRNDIVFENRNRAYGAYVIRRDYNKRIVLILLGMITGGGAIYATTLGFRPAHIATVAVPAVVEDTTILILKPDAPEPELPETHQPQAQGDMTANLPPVVTDVPVTTVPVIQDPTITTGSVTQHGPGDVFVPVVIGDPDPQPPVHITQPEPSGPVEPDELASYPGGYPEMTRFIGSNLNYPQDAIELNLQGKCYLRFVVGKDGEISDVTVMRGISDCPSCDREAKRVINKMPKWRPGKKDGKPVNSYFNIPINFKLH